MRVVLRSPPGPPVFQREADITWLPPTAQNLAKLTVPIPAGFRQVPLAGAVMPILKQTPGGLLPAPQEPCPSSAGQVCTGGISAFGSGPENVGYSPNLVFVPGRQPPTPG